MINVVVFDNEVDECKRICNLINWLNFNMEIIGIASSYDELLFFLEENPPDLILVSIISPEDEILKLINNFKLIGEELEIIIISGIGSFEYLQAAMRFGVFDYMLKPIREDELNIALQKIQDNFTKKNKKLLQEMQQKLMLQNLQKDIISLRSRFFNELLLRRVPFNGITIESVNYDYDFKFNSGFFQIFIIKFDCCHENYNNYINFFIDKPLRILKQQLYLNCADVQFHMTDNRIYGLINYKYKNNYNSIRKNLQTVLDEFLKNYDIVKGVNITIGVGSPVTNIQTLAYSLFEAEAAIAQRLIDGTENIIENSLLSPHNALSNIIITDFLRTGILNDSSVLNSDNNLSNIILRDFFKKAKSALETLNHSALVLILTDFQNKIIVLPEIKGIEFYTLIQKICRTSLNLLRNHEMCIYDIEQHYSIFIQKADMCKSTEELLTLLSGTIVSVVEMVFDELKHIEKKPIRLAKQYIRENYNKAITLDIVSDYVGFNPTYFSTLFKKESGQNFSDYLSSIRMLKAQELLKETNIKVEVICGEVGYLDLKNFTQSFKKHTGLSPSEYRKMFS